MIFQSTVYPNVIPVNGILQQYLVSGGAISAGDFVQFADAVATGTKTLIGIAPSAEVPPILLNETDVLVFGGDGNRTARVVRFDSGGITVGDAVNVVIDEVSNAATVSVESAAKLSTAEVSIGISRVGSYSAYADVALLTISGLSITPGSRVQLGVLSASSSTSNPNQVKSIQVFTLADRHGMVCYALGHQEDTLSSGKSPYTNMYVHGISTAGGYLAAGAAYQFQSYSGSKDIKIYGARISDTAALFATDGYSRTLGLVALTDQATAAVSPVGSQTTYSNGTVTAPPIILSESKFVLTQTGKAACGYINGGTNIQLGTFTSLGVTGVTASFFTKLTDSTVVATAYLSRKAYALVFRANDDLTITVGDAAQILSTTSSKPQLYPLRLAENSVFLYGYAQTLALVSGLTLSPETITTPASADILTAALYSESAGTLRVFGGTTAAKGFANSLAASVKPYSNAAYGVASTGGAVGETIDIFLPKT